MVAQGLHNPCEVLPHAPPCLLLREISRWGSRLAGCGAIEATHAPRDQKIYYAGKQFSITKLH